MFRIISILVCVFGVNACVNNSTVVIGSVAEAIDFKEVEVFYSTSPNCEFDVIALIKIPGEYYSRSSLIDGFRQKAAAVGAPAVQITYIQRIGTFEFFGSARAIRCN